ncbi:MAG: hypothetical protein B7Z37_30335 [Verrucomicrobia bacterium 12-59-8]|nr:MAG: hypothetical protein B7Z37_30335 [Verrucomicrobia bacterium 12-59-8]
MVAPKLANAKTWPWFEFLKRVSSSGQYQKIEIITFNYDPWLERILTQEAIPFEVAPIQLSTSTPPAIISIIKPHGSISFCHTQKLDKKSFAINYDKNLVDGKITDFNISYDELDANYLVTPLIPPAGEARRLNQTWAGEIQTHCQNVASSLTETDDMLICGLSYWHVDRAELDTLLNSCSAAINIKMINPKPSRTLTAVITSIFDRFICYPSCTILSKLLK